MKQLSEHLARELWIAFERGKLEAIPYLINQYTAQIRNQAIDDVLSLGDCIGDFCSWQEVKQQAQELKTQKQKEAATDVTAGASDDAK